MAMGKMTALAFGLVGGFALGVWTGPYFVPAANLADSAVHETVVVPTAPEAPSAPAAAAKARPARPAVAARAARVEVTAPALHERLKPVLNRGANMAVAADGFRSAEEFATVAHAARNTEVPFMVLKHRVLTEGKSLAQAIRESKPAVNAADEASQARAQARSDIAAIAG
jgi:hypothetical protein